MVITANQVLLFYTDADQMAIPQQTVAQLANEGIVTIEDQMGFTDSNFKQIADNIKNPPVIPDPNNPGQTIHQNHFTLGAKSLKRLKVAANVVRYYDLVGRTISQLPTCIIQMSSRLLSWNMHWHSKLQRVHCTIFPCRNIPSPT